MAFDGIDNTPLAHFVTPGELPVWAERVRPHLVKMAAGSNGRYEAADILTALAAGNMQLWLVLRGADLLCCLVTEIVTYPRAKAIRSVGVSGHRPLLWRKMLARVEAAAKEHFGCTIAEALHSPEHSILVPEYRTTHFFSEKAI